MQRVEASDRDDAFIILIILCFIGAFLSGWMFYLSFYRIAKRNAPPIARITFKYKTAQRKFLDRMAWDRIQQNSDIYNGDTVRTADLSEATIYFIDGNIMELSDNSMAQVFLRDGGGEVSLESGNAKVDASGGGLTLKSGGAAVTLEAGSSLNAAMGEGGDVSLQMLKGSAEVSGEGGGGKTLEEGESTGSAPIVMLLPHPNQKLLYHEAGNYKASFRWRTDEPSLPVTLEVAQDKSFSHIVHRITTNTDKVDVDLPHGRYYWRLSPDASSNSVAKPIDGKMLIVQSLPPKTVTPAVDYTYSYRTQKPAVRFIWTESESATSYEFAVSKDSDMSSPIITERTPQSSYILSSLEAGTYYWQVTPFYMIDQRGLEAPSEISRFNIARQASLKAPALYLPAAGGAVNIEDNSKQSIFSWKTDSEAASYRIKVMAQDGRTVVNASAANNRYGANNSLFKAGEQYRWSVSLVDSEGNESDDSEVRTFTAMNGIVEQHLVEPTDGYVVSDSLARDLKFTWRKNVPAGLLTYLTVSTDEDFKNELYDEVQDGLSKSSLPLSPGTYYWKVRTLNNGTSGEESFNIETRARRLVVVSPYPATVVHSPVGMAVAKEDVPYKFAWEGVEGAQFYRMSILEEDSGREVYADTLYTPSASLDMFHDERFRHRGHYRYEIQARSNDVPGVSSRRSGKLSEGAFTLIRLNPVAISYPANGSSVDGISAFLDGVAVRYSSVDELTSAQVVIYRLGAGGKRTAVLKTHSGGIASNDSSVAENGTYINTDEGLRAGKYEVEVNATSIDGIDVSSALSKKRTRFTILPIPPLASPAAFEASPAVIDSNYIRQGGKILRLSWLNVKDATDYDVSITKKGENSTISQCSIPAGGSPSYALDIMSLDDETKSRLLNGEFVCSVTPYRRTKDKVVQEGEASITRFSTNILPPKQSIPTGAINPYILGKKSGR